MILTKISELPQLLTREWLLYKEMRQLSCDFDTNLIFDQPMLRGTYLCVQPRQGIRCLNKQGMSVDKGSGKN